MENVFHQETESFRPWVPVRPASCAFHHCLTWQEMEEISTPGVNLVVMQRSSPEAPSSFEELLRTDHPCVDLVVDDGMDRQTASARLLDEIRLKAEDRKVLATDIASLALNFLRITGGHRAKVHLHRVDSDNCQFFHVDHVETRLLCTYQGRGTQWLRNEHANRRALGRGRNDRVAEPSALIEEIETGWVAIFRGERRNGGNGLVHRSPPMRRGDGPRLLLRVDLKH